MREISVFMHIPKTGGSTIRRVLQRSLGLGYLQAKCRDNVTPESRIFYDAGREYTKKELRRDITANPFVKCIGGHSMCAYREYEDTGMNTSWFTMFRDPIDRFLSHYQYENMVKNPPSIYEWSVSRDAPVANLQTLYLAGRWDLEAAKQILEEKIQAFGITNEFDKSLSLINSKIFSGRLDTDYPRKMNVSKFDHKSKIKNNIDTYESFLLEKNNLDIKLFGFVKDKFEKICIKSKSQKSTNIYNQYRQASKEMISKLYDKAVYSLYVGLEKRLNREGKDMYDET